ncbi:MAG: hypothetical protein E6J24_16490, partial [Chloroflexi bacterium]
MREDAVRIADRLEATLRIPDVTPRGIVVVAHPLPTHGGTMRNPLVAALARALADEGFFALRFNFRSVGASSGEWSGGREEWHDVGAAVDHARAFATLPSVAERGPLPPGLPVGVTAYSFGAVMTLRWLEEGGRADGIALVGVPLRGPDQEPRPLPPVPDGDTRRSCRNYQKRRPLLRRQARRGRSARRGRDAAGASIDGPMTSRATSGFATRSESDTSSDNETETKRTRKRILTGDRPTGKLHLGQYVGTLQNRVRLQDDYETFLLVADYHMLTSRLTKLEEIEQNIRDDVIDNL